MPFKSKAQRRKFYALKSQGKIDQGTIDRWEENTPRNLLERIGKVASRTDESNTTGHVINYSTGVSSTDDQNDNNVKVRKNETSPRLVDKTAAPNFIRGFRKFAGGPGSGVPYSNTDIIDFLETSPLISIGHRKKFLDEKTPINRNIEIKTKDIKYKGQENMIPKKLVHMMKHWNDVKDKPIDVILDSNGDYHIIDGHHRALAAILMRIESIQANVYKGA